MTAAPRVVACLKWVAHPGEPEDERFAGMSAADRSALELALRQAEAFGTGVTVVTVGPEGADRMLRDALACGAVRAVRIPTSVQPDSADVATMIARAVPDASWFWCGDYSLDRGTGSVPAFLADALGARQALGAVAVEPAGHGLVHVSRRLDGGRRELLAVEAPAVVSVEGAVAHLRRASLSAVRAAARLDVEIIAPAVTVTSSAAVVLAYRPRARVVDAPTGGDTLTRLRFLTATTEGVARSERLDLDPEAAAARILRAVREWGHLD